MSFVLQPHQRILPHMDISEQGLRELELWLRGAFTGDGGLLYHRGTYGAENNGDWLHVTATDPGKNFTAGGPVHNITGAFSIGLSAQGSVVIGAGGTDSSIWMVADDKILMRAEIFDARFQGESIFETEGLTINTGPYFQSLTSQLVFDVRGDTSIGTTSGGGNTVFELSAGKTLQVQKNGGGVVCSVGADSTQILNLQAGKTAVINDHLGSPLVTYTG